MVRVRGRTGASWRGMRLPQRLQEGLRQRHALRLHGWCIGSLILGVMWAVSHAQMALGMPSLALRYLTNQAFAALIYCHDTRCSAIALSVSNYLWLTRYHIGKSRVSCTKVNSDNLSHEYIPFH